MPFGRKTNKCGIGKKNKEDFGGRVEEDQGNKKRAMTKKKECLDKGNKGDAEVWQSYYPLHLFWKASS